MRRGDIRTALLTALTDGPAHGYEIIGRLEEKSGGMWRPSPGSVYPTLQLFEDEGLVRSEQRDGKRVYELTDAGREAVTTWVDRTSAGPRVRDEFFMKLVLGQLTGTADRLGLINRQRRHYLAQMRSLSDLAAAATRPVPRLLIEGAMLHLQADLDWLQRCQEELV